MSNNVNDFSIDQNRVSDFAEAHALYIMIHEKFKELVPDSTTLPVVFNAIVMFSATIMAVLSNQTTHKTKEAFAGDYLMEFCIFFENAKNQLSIEKH